MSETGLIPLCKDCGEPAVHGHDCADWTNNRVKVRDEVIEEQRRRNAKLESKYNAQRAEIATLRDTVERLARALEGVLGADEVNLLSGPLTGEDKEGHDPNCQLCKFATDGREALAAAAAVRGKA